MIKTWMKCLALMPLFVVGSCGDVGEAPAVANTVVSTEDSQVPRLPNGQVNLGLVPGDRGFWGSSGNIYRRGRLNLQTNLLESEIPFQPWAKELYDFRAANNHKDDPHARCLPGGPPRLVETVNGFEILPMPDIDRIYFAFGGGPRTWRVVYLDGRPLPDIDDPDMIPTYMGYSTGRWEGDELVIETNGFNEKTWFAQGGLPHTRYLRLTERISRPEFNRLKYEVTVDDPGAYTRPWSGGFYVEWTRQGWDGSDVAEIHEYFCQDNNRDVMHMIGN